MTFFKNLTYGKKEVTDSKEAIFERLRRADVPTIRALAIKVAPDVRREVRQAGLTDEDAEEVLNDAILVTLSAIRKGTFKFMDYHPAAYTKGVAKKLISNRLRSKKPKTELLDNVPNQSEFTPEIHLRNKERTALVRELLARLGEDCRRVLVLKYFEHRRDKEVVLEKLSPYSTVASLKSKRGQCLKKLTELAKKAGITEVF